MAFWGGGDFFSIVLHFVRVADTLWCRDKSDGGVLT